MTCWRAALQRSGMETRKHRFSTRGISLGDTASSSPTAFATKPLNGLDRWMGGRRDGHRGATGGAWPDPDSASRCHGATWEISYIAYTCVACQLHVRLHAMEIVTRQADPRAAGSRPDSTPMTAFRAVNRADALGWRTVAHSMGREMAPRPFGWMDRRAERVVDARSKLLRPGKQADPARLGRREDRARHRGQRTSPAASMSRTLVGRGRVSARRTPMRRDSASLGAAIAVKPGYPLGPRSACPRAGLAGGLAPCDPHNGNGAL